MKRFQRGLIELVVLAMMAGCVALAAWPAKGAPVRKICSDGTVVLYKKPCPKPAPEPTPNPTPTPSPTPSPTPTPTPTPEPSPPPEQTVPVTGLAPIASNFDAAGLLSPSWGTGQVPVSNVPDTVGAFRFICNASHLAYDDPIVYPGQVGKSHLHQFFGNTLADGNSTYESLRTTGDSTCNNRLNRSAYWIPAMLDGHGSVVTPDYVSVYYKRFPAGSAECTRQGIACVDLPRGLRYVFGRNMLNLADLPTGMAYFNCDGPGATGGHYPDMVAALPFCPVGSKIGAVINAPNCWDGKNLDSADHRSHVAYASYGDWGYLRCPPTHPYVMATFTMGVWYTVDLNLPFWTLASDHMNPGGKPGSTLHADWWGAWDDPAMALWTAHCINKLLNCSGGDLGNGQQLTMYPGFKWAAAPRLVPVPAMVP